MKRFSSSAKYITVTKEEEMLFISMLLHVAKVNLQRKRGLNEVKALYVSTATKIYR